jgi:hypothetical protein
MTDDPGAIDRLAAQIRAALQSADLDAYRDLLDPDVAWSPPDDLTSGCHNRKVVLAWYGRGRERGTRADVTDVVSHRDKILVGLKVYVPDESDESSESDRWQPLTVVSGRVKDIQGFDVREEAVARMK